MMFSLYFACDIFARKAMLEEAIFLDDYANYMARKVDACQSELAGLEFYFWDN